MVIHFRVRHGEQTLMARGAQAFMAQAKTYQYTFIMVFAKGMFREGARDGPVCFTVSEAKRRQLEGAPENKKLGFETLF